MTDTQLYIIAVLCAFCAGICSHSAWQALRAAKNLRQKRPGFVELSPHVYVPANPGTAPTRARSTTSTGYSSEVPSGTTLRRALASTAGQSGLADRLRTGSPMRSTSGTESNRGDHTTGADTITRGRSLANALGTTQEPEPVSPKGLGAAGLTSRRLRQHGPWGWISEPAESPWRSNGLPHTDTDTP